MPNQRYSENFIENFRESTDSCFGGTCSKIKVDCTGLTPLTNSSLYVVPHFGLLIAQHVPLISTQLVFFATQSIKTLFECKKQTSLLTFKSSIFYPIQGRLWEWCIDSFTNRFCSPRVTKKCHASKENYAFTRKLTGFHNWLKFQSHFSRFCAEQFTHVKLMIHYSPSEFLLPSELLPNVLCWLFWLNHRTLHLLNCTYFSAHPIQFVKAILNSCPIFQSAQGHFDITCKYNSLYSSSHYTESTCSFSVSSSWSSSFFWVYKNLVSDIPYVQTVAANGGLQTVFPKFPSCPFSKGEHMVGIIVLGNFLCFPLHRPKHNPHPEIIPSSSHFSPMSTQICCICFCKETGIHCNLSLAKIVTDPCCNLLCAFTFKSIEAHYPLDFLFWRPPQFYF